MVRPRLARLVLMLKVLLARILLVRLAMMLRVLQVLPMPGRLFLRLGPKVLQVHPASFARAAA